MEAPVLPDLPCTLAVEFLTELGHLDDPVSIIAPHDHRNIARTRDGRWIVVSVGMPPPLVYAADGSLGGTVGRVGEGPGEFVDPDRIAVDRTDSIWISDPGGRVVILDPDGVPARLLRSSGYVIDGFTPSNEPYTVRVRLLEIHREGERPEVRGVFPYVTVWSRELDQEWGFGPGLDDPAAEGRTIRMSPWGTVFAADSVVLTQGLDQDRSWIDRWIPGAREVWVPRRDVWAVLAHDGALEPSSIRNLALIGDREEGFWSLAGVPRPPEPEDAASSGGTHDTDRQPPAYATHLLHLSAEGAVTGVLAIPELDPHFETPHFIDHEHLVSPWVDRDTGLITLRIWRVSRECESG